MTTHSHEANDAAGVERALVLGGGGPVGYAWTAGLLSGLVDAGRDLRRAERIVGTSAGAIAGAQFALGVDVAAGLSTELNRRSEPSPYESAATGGIGDLLSIFAGAARAADPDQARAAIGATALAAKTMTEEEFLAGPGYASLAGQVWPPAFRATAVSATTGRLVVWSADSGVDLAKAVASSSSVPGFTPPVTMHGDRYMDGGARSSLNADLVAGARSVIVVSCTALTPPEGLDPALAAPYEDQAAELDAIRAAGGSLAVIEPGPEFLALSGHGTRLMDMGLIPEAFQVGREQGAKEAPRLDSW
ncbi:patatin-like phospholipase family protein [Amycolatopsis sp. NBC_00345]|uniref:patatin-like phospholipase family protein n=1 Tax=Amycolatopsis sp. NBC_00345 TaxID=2975955 RepID=UPI002E264E61